MEEQRVGKDSGGTDEGILGGGGVSLSTEHEGLTSGGGGTMVRLTRIQGERQILEQHRVKGRRTGYSLKLFRVRELILVVLQACKEGQDSGLCIQAVTYS